MSFAGFYQIICEQGHQRNEDCYDFNECNWTCDCGATVAWWNLCDETNGCYCHGDSGNENCPGCEYCQEGRIDGYVELERDEEDEYEICLCCHHRRLVKEGTFKIPEGVGHRAT